MLESTGCSTLADAVVRTAELHPDNGFTFQDSAGAESFHSFVQIAGDTANRAGALLDADVRKGDRVAMIVVDPEQFVMTFFAAMRIGAVPVPMYPPMYFGSLDHYLRQAADILVAARASVLVVSSELQNLLWALVDRVPTLRRLISAEGLAKGQSPARFPTVAPDDLAFLQYTSGSTSQPKGVMVTHRCLVANIHAVSHAVLQMHPDRDKGVSWLPLYHDMGLIGFCISPMFMGVNQVFIPTLRFIKNVSVWMDAMHRHRGTVSFAPNFAYALATKRARPEQLDRWDLSCVKMLGCGSEPIRVDTLRAFARVFGERCKLAPSTLAPAYGLAEATLALTMKPLHGEFRTQRVDAARFQEAGQVKPPRDGGAVEEHISCGEVVPGHEIRVINETGAPVPDGLEGEVCARGPSITPGYYSDQQQTTAINADGWLRTGDLGYMIDGQLYITGRIKDLIILHGRNIHPQSIEWALDGVEGLRKGNAVAFSRPGPQTEELVIVVEALPRDHAAVAARITTTLQETLSLSVADVVCLPPGGLPKTSSGKLQRRKTRAQYLDGSLGKELTRLTATNRVDVARHVARSLWARARAIVKTR